ncbi:MAG: desulfoferrodoxin family protein [Eggerthellaceae bacterium]|jgi:superoxide reductase
MSMRFMKDAAHGDLVIKLYDNGAELSSAGEALTEIKANDTDAAKEKHVPVVSVDGSHVHVAVGSVEHPMTEDHYITCIMLETEKTFQIAYLTPTDKPEADFEIAADDKPRTAYEYCNKHGLWKADIA